MNPHRLGDNFIREEDIGVAQSRFSICFIAPYELIHAHYSEFIDMLNFSVSGLMDELGIRTWRLASWYGRHFESNMIVEVYASFVVNLPPGLTPDECERHFREISSSSSPFWTTVGIAEQEQALGGTDEHGNKLRFTAPCPRCGEPCEWIAYAHPPTPGWCRCLDTTS